MYELTYDIIVRHNVFRLMQQEKLLAEIKRKREKVSAELKEVRAGKRDAEKRCRLLEEEKEAICDDYEGRLQQQVCM